MLEEGVTGSTRKTTIGRVTGLLARKGELDGGLPVEKKERRPGEEMLPVMVLDPDMSAPIHLLNPHRRGQRRSRSPSAADSGGWNEVGSDVKAVEQRLKSFTSQLHTECGILERLVYKHKNQHRRCSYFQYILKVRRDLQLLKSVNLEEVLESAFLVINGDRPKQKVQLLEGLKRRKTNSGKYNFLERLLGATRLLSQIVEPLLKAAIEISMLLARSFFLKFSLAILAVLARIRVLVQQMVLDAVLLYNTVSSVSRKEQSIKLKQDGFEVFREYFPRKEETIILLDCIWEKDKFVLVETTHKNETTNQEKDEQADFSLNTQKILYENIEVILGGDI